MDIFEEIIMATWRPSQAAWRKNSVAGRYQTTMSHIKRRAKEKGLPCDLTAKYLASITPSHCPVLGIPIQHSEGVATDNSPSIDRLVPELGYVQGNVIIVSKLANQIRSTGTPDQIIRVGEFYRDLLTPATVDPKSEITDNERN